MQLIEPMRRLFRRERLTLGVAVRLAVASAIIGAVATAGYYALSVIYSNKLMDTWAIMFLELEQQGHRLTERLATLKSGADRGDGAAVSVLARRPDGTLEPLQGPISRQLTAAALGFDGKAVPRALAPITVVEHAGEAFTAVWSEGKLLLVKIPVGLFGAVLSPGHRGARPDGATVYVVTREGKLVYSSDPKITGVNFARRPLAQRFIGAPLSQGQLEFANEGGVASYGFFREVPRSNLVMFAEVRRSDALASIDTITGRFLVVSGLILFLTLVLLQPPITSIVRPMRELTELARQIGQGRFGVKATAAGVGEMSLLAEAFNTMADNLETRDHTIRNLTQEQMEKLRLEGELKVARGIQTNLLPVGSLPEASGVDIGATYVPATECAGDWYNFHYNASGDETIVAVADVSGHGAGSSMFTAIIAGVFHRYKTQEDGPWAIDSFLREVNDVIYGIGKGAWSATMLVARYRRAAGEVELLAAGHNPPLVSYPSGREPAPSGRIRLPSAPMGFFPVCEAMTTMIPFPSGSRLLLYTDGLVEARNARGQMLQLKRVTRAFEALPDLDAQTAAEQLLGTWDRHRAGHPADDDACVVVMSAA